MMKMKPLTNSGGLVEFKENIIFEKYKDKEIGSNKLFKINCKKEHGFEPSNDLFRKIVNYQVKTYGRTLVFESRKIEKLTKNQMMQNKRHRETVGGNSAAYYKTQAIIARAEKRLKNASK